MSTYRVIVMLEPETPAPYDVEGVRIVAGADITQIVDANDDAVLTVPTQRLVSAERLADQSRESVRVPRARRMP